MGVSELKGRSVSLTVRGRTSGKERPGFTGSSNSLEEYFLFLWTMGTHCSILAGCMMIRFSRKQIFQLWCREWIGEQLNGQDGMLRSQEVNKDDNQIMMVWPAWWQQDRQIGSDISVYLIIIYMQCSLIFITQVNYSFFLQKKSSSNITIKPLTEVRESRTLLPPP